MRQSARVVLICSFIALVCVAAVTCPAGAQEKRWVNFSYDKNTPGTEYYYDRDTVSFLSDNRVSVWLKVATPEGEELLQTEIECSGSMFRTIEPYKPYWEKPVKTSHAQYGWLAIPPDSEIFLLKKILCKPR